MRKIKSQAMLDYEKALRMAICQYCLDSGHGVYNENIDYDLCDIKHPMQMTTAAEKTRAKIANEEPRYIILDAIEYFENHKRPRQVLELLKNGYYLIDWDEWQKLQDILGVELSYKSAKKISDILWSDTSVNNTLSVMDIGYSIHDPGSAAFLTKFINEFVPDTCRNKVVNALLDDGIDIYKLIESRSSDDCDMTNAKYPVPEYPVDAEHIEQAAQISPAAERTEISDKKEKAKEVYLVHLIYQYDGWDGTSVYSTREKAINAADELLSEQQQSGYAVSTDYDNGYSKFSECDDNSEYMLIRLSSDNGDVEIIVEKKIML